MTTPHYELRKRLMVAQIASCSCLTKTPDPHYHKDECRYRVLADALAALEAVDDAAAAGTVPNGQPTNNPMCEHKTDHIMERDGYAKTGYVLRKPGAEREVCVSDGGAVSWFTLDQWNWLMFNRDHVEFSWPKPIGAPGAFGTSHMVLTGKAEQEQEKNRTARTMLDNLAIRRPTLTRDQIRSIFMAHGFTIKEGQTDLKDYVYAAAEALLAAGVPVPCTPDLAQLREAAQSALHTGEWYNAGCGTVHDGEHNEVAHPYDPSAVAHIVAAQPRVVLDLLGSLERTIAAHAALQKQMTEDWCPECHARETSAPDDAGKSWRDHAVLVEALACVEYYEGQELADRVSAVLAKHGARIGAYTPPVVVDAEDVFSASLYFRWARQGTGFGELSLHRGEDGRVTCMNECMGRAFVRSALYALADTLADVAELQELR